eukprot:CAMPEP_0174364424 /NCGR_PEP_ID=MMETSP0811_2-20130205/72844_1 /TAXON_ID=73025 ORGANISM="Eutreptiella gymnastica-like, Strain CCMP1594" /NCGR_SAMPLE_ID=MMETSP0811_2 /ASSEMBLY_ACC=CAM_ASM_000667 /LENGTH=37 /DNA_ID= /DNA_START= /DNA_END= /DNA_ORIENTATION=
MARGAPGHLGLNMDAAPGLWRRCPTPTQEPRLSSGMV